MDIDFINSREFAKRVVNYKTDRLIHIELQNIHYELFKKNFQVNCGSCIKQAYVSIREAINNTMVITNQTKKQMGLFEIKKGANGISKQIHIDHDIITNDNLTDEKAINILRKHPSHIVTFSRFPENWKELISGKKIILKEVEEETKTDKIIEEPVKSIVTESKKNVKNKKR